jgi:hypothetical protein
MLKNLSARKLNALILIGLGFLLMKATSVFGPTLVNNNANYLGAIVYLFSPLGAIFLILGAYRFFTKGKGE